MRLTFLGAAGEVTGSCLLVEAGRARFVVDCGMFQGGREAGRRNREASGRDLGRLDFALLTHAHIDHCGLLPRFTRGARPLVYCTKPTADLVPVMLHDSARLQARGTHKPRRRAPEEPLYDAEDVDRLATQPFLTEGTVIREILGYPGEPTSPPRRMPARRPPLWEMQDSGSDAIDPQVQPASDYEFDPRIAR